MLQGCEKGGNRDRGEPLGSSPPTPPCVRVHTRRFGWLSDSFSPCFWVCSASQTFRSLSASLEASPLLTPLRPAILGFLPHYTCEFRILLATPTVWAFRVPFPVRASPAVSPLSGECLNRVNRLRSLTMPAADFCATIRKPHGFLSPDSGTWRRSPEVSSTAFHAPPPDLRFAPLMEEDFAVSCPLVRHSRLISGFCSSARVFATRFFQTPSHDDALALR